MFRSQSTFFDKNLICALAPDQINFTSRERTWMYGQSKFNAFCNNLNNEKLKGLKTRELDLLIAIKNLPADIADAILICCFQFFFKTQVVTVFVLISAVKIQGKDRLKVNHTQKPTDLLANLLPLLDKVGRSNKRPSKTWRFPCPYSVCMPLQHMPYSISVREKPTCWYLFVSWFPIKTFAELPLSILVSIATPALNYISKKVKIRRESSTLQRKSKKTRRERRLMTRW